MGTTSIDGMVALWGWDETSVTAVGFEPTPLRTGALSQRLRPLGQTVVMALQDVPLGFASHDTYNCMDAGARSSLLAFWYMHAKTTSKHASAGNRTRVTSMATMYSTTIPLMPAHQRHGRQLGCTPARPHHNIDAQRARTCKCNTTIACWRPAVDM